MTLEDLLIRQKELAVRVEKLETQDSEIVPTLIQSGAPVDASFVVVNYNGSLTNERRLEATSILTVTDGGPNNPITIAIGDHARGSLIVGGAAEWEGLPIGAAATFMRSDGVDATWGAIQATDLPVHTHSSAVDGGSLVVGTTDTDATAGSVFFAGVAGVIQEDNANFFWDDGNDRLGLGTNNPDEMLHMLSSASAKPALVIENTNADSQAPVIEFYKNTASPLASDDLGAFDFFGETSTGAKDRYAFWLAESLDVTNGATGGGMAFMVTMNGTDRFLLRLTGFNGLVNQGEVVINEEGQDVDFIVEGVGAATALFVQGSDGRVGAGIGAPLAQVHVDQSAGAGAIPVLILDQGDPSEQCIQFSSDGADQDFFLWTIAVTGTPSLMWDESETAIIYAGTDIHLNDGAQDVLKLRSTGDVSAVESDIYAEASMGIAADNNVHVFIDADASGTDGVFTIQKDAENVAGATELIRITEGPIFFLNETSNANMTQGITLDQGANDDEIFNARSSDVGAVRNTVETGTYFVVEKSSGAAGGAFLQGYGDGGIAQAAFVVQGNLAANPDTTHTQAGRGLIEFQGFETDGTNLANTVADGNILVVRTRRGGATVSLLIVDAEGDIFADGGGPSTTMVTLFDDYHDAELIRAFDINRGPAQVIRSEWDKYIRYNEDTLIEAGVLGGSLADGGLTNVTQLQRLHNGAIWQNYTYIRQLERALLDAGIDVPRLEAG